jgi:hypothetical protein
MNRIEDYQAFAAIVEKRSLTAAGHSGGRVHRAVGMSLTSTLYFSMA